MLTLVQIIHANHYQNESAYWYTKVWEARESGDMLLASHYQRLSYMNSLDAMHHMGLID